MALIKIMKARTKMIMDALPSITMILLTTCCPITAATVATATKYAANTQIQSLHNLLFSHVPDNLIYDLMFRCTYRKELGNVSEDNIQQLTSKRRTSWRMWPWHLRPEEECLIPEIEDPSQIHPQRLEDLLPCQPGLRIGHN